MENGPPSTKMAKTRLNGVVVTSATTAEEEGLPSSSSSSSFEEQQQQHDAFLLSMTFGNSGNNNCNCSDDECNTTYTNNATTAANNVPRSIREAVIDHNNARTKRQRTQQNSNNYSRRRRQSRELVRRECGFALYRLALPVSNDNSDPIIVEYRNNHRILYIHRLDSNNINDNNNNNRLYSIGEGIIGSAYEESTRKQLNWVEGTSYLLPKCTGIACGWVVQYYDSQQEQDKFGGDYDVNNDDDDNIEDDENNDNFDMGETTKDNNNDNRVTTTTAADESVDNGADAVVIMYSLKISSKDLQSMIHTLPTDTVLGGTSPSTWVVKARELFLGRLSSLKAVEEKKMNKYDDDDGDDVDIAVDESSLKDCIALSENESASMKLIIELAT